MAAQETPPSQDDFGTLLGKILTRKDRSKTWLANKVGVNRSTVKNWSDNNSKPNKENLKTIIEVLEIKDPVEKKALVEAAGYSVKLTEEVGNGEPTNILLDPTEIAIPSTEDQSFGQRIDAIVHSVLKFFAQHRPLFLIGLLIFLLVFLSRHILSEPKPDPPDLNDFVGQYNACTLSQQQGDFDLAIGYCTRAIELKPDAGFPYYARAYSYYEKNDFATALIDLDQAIRLIQPDYGWAYQLRGRVHKGLGNHQFAFQDFLKVLEMEKQSRDTCQSGALNFGSVSCDNWPTLQERACENVNALLKMVAFPETDSEFKALMKDCPTQQ